MMKNIALAALISLAVGGASAQVYVGGVFGKTAVDVDCDYEFECDKQDSGYKLYGGFKVSPNAALEIGYMDFGGMTYADIYGIGEGKVSATALTFGVAFRGNVTPQLAGVARLGMANVETRDKGFASGFGSFSDSDSKVSPYFGLALEYAFNKNVKGVLAADFTKAEIGEESYAVRLLSVGAQIDF